MAIFVASGKHFENIVNCKNFDAQQFKPFLRLFSVRGGGGDPPFRQAFLVLRFSVKQVRGGGVVFDGFPSVHDNFCRLCFW